MDKEHGSVLLRVLVSAGIILFVLNSIYFYIENPGEKLIFTTLVSFIFQIVIGIIISILSLRHTKKAYQFFIGLILSGWGILNCLIKFILPNDHTFWWPLYLVLSSIFIFLAGKIKYGKVKFGYLIPSLTLFIMGIWFCLFSFKILKISFKTVVIILGPAFLVLIGISLVFVFLIQQRHKKLILNDEDSGDFDDEELSFPKLD